MVNALTPIASPLPACLLITRSDPPRPPANPARTPRRNSTPTGQATPSGQPLPQHPCSDHSPDCKADDCQSEQVAEPAEVLRCVARVVHGELGRLSNRDLGDSG